MRGRLLHSSLLLLGIVLAAAACGGDEAEVGVGLGLVLEVDRKAGIVTIEHGDIPGLMKGMTMDFEVSEPALLEGVEPGQRVAFRVREQAGRYTVVEIESP